MDLELKKVIKMIWAGRTARFALVLKGNSDGALILSEKPISKKRLLELKGELGGGAVVKGSCSGDASNNSLVFETNRPFHNWIPLIRKLIKREAGLSTTPEFRLAPETGETESEAP